MSDKTDPRMDVLREPSAVTPGQLLADLDSADRAAGIVRVDTNDEALVERVAKVMYENPGGYFPPWDEVGDIKNVYRAEARAILAALRGES